MIAPAARETLSPDALSDAERARLRELILCVNRGMTQFLEVGWALMAIKTERLYRETHCDFDQFCRDTFGLPRSHCETLVKSTRTAELLIQSGAQIPAGIPESCIRPVSKLPDPDLQTAVWKFVEAVSPAQGPTSTLVAKVVRTIKNAIAEASPDGKGPWQLTHKREYPPAELPFLRPLSKIAGWQGFDVVLVVSHIESKERAMRVAQAPSPMPRRSSFRISSTIKL